jgi:hypothetical protein
MSHIPRRFEEKLQTARGKREAFTVNQLPDEPTPAEHVASLRAEWRTADAGRRKVIEEKVAELTAPPKVVDQGPAEHQPTLGAVDMTDPLVQQEAEEWAAQQAKLNQPEGQ